METHKKVTFTISLVFIKNETIKLYNISKIQSEFDEKYKKIDSIVVDQNKQKLRKPEHRHLC